MLFLIAFWCVLLNWRIGANCKFDDNQNLPFWYYSYTEWQFKNIVNSFLFYEILQWFIFFWNNLSLHMGMTVLCLSHTILVRGKRNETHWACGISLTLSCLLIGWFSEYLLDNFNSSQLYLWNLCIQTAVSCLTVWLYLQFK